jgi:hypothetical protein
VGDADLWLGAPGLDGEHALEDSAGFIERPFVEAGLREQEQQRHIRRGDGDGLAEGIELGHGRRVGSAEERESGKCAARAAVLTLILLIFIFIILQSWMHPQPGRVDEEEEAGGTHIAIFRMSDS